MTITNRAGISLLALFLCVFACAAPAAQASQWPAVRTAATVPYTFSRIAWTGSDAVITATDSHGDLYYFWQAAGTTTWHKQLVAAAATGLVFSKPSPIAVASSTLYFAAATTSGALYVFTKTGTANWGSVLLSAGPGKYQNPSIAAAGDGTVLISVGNTVSGLVSFTKAPGGSTWVEETLSFATFGPSAITTVFDKLNSSYLGLVTAASAGSLYFFWEELASPGWIQETVQTPGGGGTFNGGSITASSANITIAAGATTGDVYSFTQPLGSTTWAAQTVTTSGGPFTAPQIAWTGPTTTGSYDVITAANSAGALHFWWEADGSSGGWTPETVASNGTHAHYTAPGIATTSTSTVITAINTKPGNVMYWSQAFGATPWHKEVVATG